MSEYFPEPKCSRGRVKVELDLSNYATKADSKMQQVLIHQNLLKKVDAAVQKDVYNADIKNIEGKIPDITNLATNTSLNAKIN